MKMFGNILSKLGFGEAAQAAEAPTETPASVVTNEAPTPVEQADVVEEIVEEVESISQIDVVAKLEGLAGSSGLNWKTSIVDLLKVLELDSSFSARKELAAELSCPAEKMQDSAQMNMWLHKTVLQKLAQNGGNIPSDLL